MANTLTSKIGLRLFQGENELMFMKSLKVCLGK